MGPHPRTTQAKVRAHVAKQVDVCRGKMARRSKLTKGLGNPVCSGGFVVAGVLLFSDEGTCGCFGISRDFSHNFATH